jgi:hypothetical protein
MPNEIAELAILDGARASVGFQHVHLVRVGGIDVAVDYI